MKIGVLPEQSLPLIGNAGILTAAHFQRVKESHPEYANRLADQLLESFTSHIRVLGQEPRLPAPDQELRVQLDQKHVHVFFPAPIDPPPEVVVESPGETARVSVIFVDELGFIAEFDPAVPPDLAFPFLTSVPEPSRKRITSTKKKRN